ncbi:AMP-binding protein [Kitasatospora sp. NPDC086791]|uniref:AMP-binding protein n=1 Tax=Kitasatospora sp. NPDC086791 TaxID=3155178 RepID=UPI00341AAE06
MPHHRPIALSGAERPGQVSPTEQVALYFEGDAGDSRRIGHAQLCDEVDRAAGALRALGVGRDDRVALHLPMIPELVVALLACDQVGALPTTLAGRPGTGPEPADEPLGGDRGTQAELVITADGGYRQGWPVAWKPAVDRALDGRRSAPPVLVVRRTGRPVTWTPGRDHWWHDVTRYRPVRPRGRRPVEGGPGQFGLRTGGDVLWCTADSDWLVENPAAVREPLAAGATQLIWEGEPRGDAPESLWRLVEKYGVTVWHADPGALTELLRGTPAPVDGYDLSSLRQVAGLGAGLGPGAPGGGWFWRRERLGAGRSTAWELCDRARSRFEAPSRPEVPAQRRARLSAVR